MRIYHEMSPLEKIPNHELTTSYVSLALTVVGLIACIVSQL